MFLILNLFLSFALASSESQLPRLESAGSGCPDNFCIWIVGRNLGPRSIVYVHDKNKIISRYVSTPTKNPDNDVITFALKSSEEMDLFENKGLTISVLNADTLNLSNRVLVKRSGPPSPKINRQKATLPLQIGGTNYVMYDLGDYLSDQNKWGDPEKGVKMLIARYHENPEVVKKHIRAIAMSGQKVLSILFWYVIYPGVKDNIHMHTVNISGGIPAQQLQNTIDILNEIKKYDFKKVILRFGPQGNETATSWTNWKEESYQTQWRAIDQLIQVFNSELKNSNVMPIYDLAAEGAGLTDGQNKNFLVRLWRDYSTKYGVNNTVGFSAAYYPGRFKSMVESLDENSLPRPNMYAVDIYGPQDDDASFYRLAKEMSELGELHKPILLQETYYNDVLMMQIVNKARNNFGLNITSIIQWNLTRAGDINGDKHFSLVDPSQYHAYLNLRLRPEILSVMPSAGNCFKVKFKMQSSRVAKLNVLDYWGLGTRFESIQVNRNTKRVCLSDGRAIEQSKKIGLTFILEEIGENKSKEYILSR